MHLHTWGKNNTHINIHMFIHHKQCRSEQERQNNVFLLHDTYELLCQRLSATLTYSDLEFVRNAKRVVYLSASTTSLVCIRCMPMWFTSTAFIYTGYRDRPLDNKQIKPSKASTLCLLRTSTTPEHVHDLEG